MGYQFGGIVRDLIRQTRSENVDPELMQILSLIEDQQLYQDDGGVTAEQCICLLFGLSRYRCWKLSRETNKYVPVEGIVGGPVYREADRQFKGDNVLPVREIVYNGDRYITTVDE